MNSTSQIIITRRAYNYKGVMHVRGWTETFTTRLSTRGAGSGDVTSCGMLSIERTHVTLSLSFEFQVKRHVDSLQLRK